MWLGALTVPIVGLLAGMWLMSFGSRQNKSSDRIDIGSKLMLSSPDISYAMTTAQNNLAQIRLGKLAAAKAGDSDVRSFGKQMVDDYVKASDQLRVIAQQQNMTLPDVVSVKDQVTIDQLAKLSGSSFDKVYLDRMLKDQEAELKSSRKQAATGKNTSIRGFASQMVATLRDHLDRIRLIQSKVKVSR